MYKLIPGFKGGLTNDQYDSLEKQTFQTTKDLEIFTNTNTLSPHLALGADATDKTRNNIQLDSSIKASDSRIYFKGFDNTAGTTLTMWDAGTSLSGSTALTAETVAAGTVSKHGMVEFKGTDTSARLFYFQSASDIQSFNFSAISGAIVASVSNQAPIFVHQGLRKMFYTTQDTNGVSGNALASTSTAATLTNTPVITFDANQRIIQMADFGAFVAIGLNTLNNSENAKVALWDGSATTVDELINIGDYGLQGIANLNGTLYFLTTSNPAGFGKFNVIRIYRWAGRGGVDLIWELDLKPTVTNAVLINPAAIAVHKDTLFFGMNASTANSMTIDNGVYAYNQRTGLFTLDRITEDTTNVNITSISIMEGSPVVTWTDATNYRINHVPASGNKSAIGVYQSNRFFFDPVFKGRAKRILLRHKELPSSTGFTVKVKEIGKYSESGTPPSAPAFTTAGTQTTANTTRTLINSINGTPFNWCDGFQIEIDFDTISTVNAAEVIFPIIIEYEVSDSLTR